MSQTAALAKNDPLTFSSSRLFSISASVAANALTISASALSLDFRSATLGSGTITTVSGTPSNLVVPSGATLGTVSGQQSRLAVLCVNDSGTLKLAVVNLAGGFSLDETNLLTVGNTTPISADSTSSTTVYIFGGISGNSTYRVIGYIESTQSTAGTWATAPSTIQGAGGGYGVSGIAHGQLLRITRYSVAGSGTWTKQADTNSILVKAVAGGGGGAGASSSITAAGNGGYSGCYGEKLITALSATYAYTVGAAGAGGAVNAAGSAGGQTSFDVLTLTGGPGGQIAHLALVALPTGSGWDFTSASPGGPGSTDSTTNAYAASGVGGSSPFAGGGVGSGSTTLPGNYGSGGGGGSRMSNTAYAGSNGGTGHIQVWEFA